MKELVLDTPVVLRNPSALSKRFLNARLIIPDIVEREIQFIASKRRDTVELPSLIADSAKKGIIGIERTPSGFSSKHKTTSLTLADGLVFQYLEYLQTEQHDFAFVTSDKNLTALCATAGIATMGQTEFTLFLANSKETDNDIASRAARVQRTQVLTTITSFVVGIISSLGASFFSRFAHPIFAYINIWGTLAVLFIAGIVLYVFRARLRLVYGTFEFGFGFILAAKVFWPKFDYTSLPASDYLQVVASLYIMVRGLDNIQKGLKGTFLEPLLERIAPSA